MELRCHDGSRLRGDAPLVATGRTPNGDLLDAERAGVKVTARPSWLTSTSAQPARGVRTGDISSDYQLKHVANHEARV